MQGSPGFRPESLILTVSDFLEAVFVEPDTSDHLALRTFAYTVSSIAISHCRGFLEILTCPYSTASSSLCSPHRPLCCTILTSAQVSSWSFSSTAKQVQVTQAPCTNCKTLRRDELMKQSEICTFVFLFSSLGTDECHANNQTNDQSCQKTGH